MLRRYRFPKQKNDKWRFISLSTNQCCLQVMVQNAPFATLTVNGVVFDSVWQLWCTLVNLDLMPCQNKNVELWSGDARYLTIVKCGYVYTIIFVQVYEMGQTMNPTTVLHSIFIKVCPITSEGILMDLEPNSCASDSLYADRNTATP